MTSPFTPPTAECIGVRVLGATGSVGQRFVALLAEHPWFEVRAVCASERSVGRPYRDAVRWIQDEPIPAAIAEMEVTPCEPTNTAALAFSALDADVATDIERACARAGEHVVSNARSHRMEPDVPLLVPEVNPGALELLATQDRGPGKIVTNPNCSTIGLTLALAPLERAFGVERVHVVTLQALSGAGLTGPTGYETTDNVIPFISGEEDKLVIETAKIFDREIPVSAACNRVGVIDGHSMCVSVTLGSNPSAADIEDAWRPYRRAPQELALPSAPERPIVVLDDADGPQPRKHRELEKGMATVVGRLRPCELLGWKFVGLSHNTLRGAAGGSILAAELALARGAIGV